MTPEQSKFPMRRKAMWLAGGLLAVSTGAFALLSGSVAQPATFESRWLAADGPVQKGDRIDGPRRGSEGHIYLFELPTVQTTVVIKQQAKPADIEKETDGIEDRRDGSMKDIPVTPAGIGGKAKLPIGCEPSFSPVTVPAMAHVSARCLS